MTGAPASALSRAATVANQSLNGQHIISIFFFFYFLQSQVHTKMHLRGVV